MTTRSPEAQTALILAQCLRDGHISFEEYIAACNQLQALTGGAVPQISVNRTNQPLFNR